MKTLTLFTLLCGCIAARADVPSVKDVVELQDYAPCGTVSLYLAAQMREVPAEWNQVVELVGPMKADRTHSFEDLSRAAKHLGMHPVGLHASRESLKNLPMPAIVQVHDPKNPDEPAHLLVLVRTEADGVWLLDAPFPAHFLPDSKFAETWTGNTLVFARDAAEASQIAAPTQDRRLTSVALWVLVGAGGVLLLVFALRSWVLTRRQAGTVMRSSWTLLALPRRRIAIGSVVALGIVVGFAVILGSGQLSARADLPPRCVFEQPVFELGQLPLGENTIPVTIKNDGDAPLLISSVQSTCSCAVVKAPESIEPRQSVVIEVVLTVSPGPHGARITIESNDPAGAKHLALSWQGAAEPRCVPGGISEPAAPIGRPYERTLKVIYPGGKSAIQPHVEKFECPSPRVKVREGSNNPTAARFANSGLLVNVQGELEVHVTVDPASSPDLLQTAGTLVLRHGNSIVNVRVPIDVRFTGTALAPDVDTVSFAAGRPGELVGQERTIRVTSKAGGEIEVRDVPAWMACTVVDRDERGFSLQLKIVEQPRDPLSQFAISVGATNEAGSFVPVSVNVFTNGL